MARFNLKLSEYGSQDEPFLCSQITNGKIILKTVHLPVEI